MRPEGTPFGEPQRREDAASRDPAFYGPRDGLPVSSPYLMTDTQAENLAGFKVLLYKDPVDPARGVRLSNRDDTLIVKQLGLDLGDRVALSESLGGTSLTGTIEGVQHRIWGAGRFHETEFTVTRRRFDAITIGTSTIGGSHVIGY
jgi:hypothetical protein